ncbi:hypothetical protein K2P47_03180 [Patescibacteria group bacterium]|nr:hypothetical protein [Patescibacteria group bacterium]
MLEKRNIEAFLKVNGIPPTAKDEEIRSVLLSARWNNNEVDTALMVLKENIKSNETHVDTLHKVFNSDDRLSASEISKLLGIDVTLSDNDVNDLNAKHQLSQNSTAVITFILSIVIAVSSIGYLMYKEQAGVFHSTDTSINVK